MTTHEEKLKTEIKVLQSRLKTLKGRRVYKEDFEEEMREVIDTLHIIVSSNPIFQNFKELELPDKMGSNWFEYEADEYEDEAFDLLKKSIKETERSCKQLLMFLKTLPKEKKPEEVTKVPKIESKITKDKTIPTKIRVGTSTFIESTFKLKEKEFIIFILGLLFGLVIGFILGVALE